MAQTVPPSATQRALVELGPDLRARVPYQQADRFARVAEGQDEKARPRYLPVCG